MTKKTTKKTSGASVKASSKAKTFAQARPAGGAYTSKVIEHFQKPHNYGRMEDPDGVGKVGNTVCGDVMWLYIRVGAKNKKEAEERVQVGDTVTFQLGLAQLGGKLHRRNH